MSLVKHLPMFTGQTAALVLEFIPAACHWSNTCPCSLVKLGVTPLPNGLQEGKECVMHECLPEVPRPFQSDGQTVLEFVRSMAAMGVGLRSDETATEGAGGGVWEDSTVTRSGEAAKMHHAIVSAESDVARALQVYHSLAPGSGAPVRLRLEAGAKRECR